MKYKHFKGVTSLGLILVFILFTVGLKTVDVEPIGPMDSEVGFAAVNVLLKNNVHESTYWFDLTEWIGMVAVFTTAIYGLIGLTQLVQRKSIYKVEPSILSLGCLYTIICLTYLFFEKVIVNYRPILIHGKLEASYPSSHVLLAICVFGSTILQVLRKVRNPLMKKSVTVICVILMLFMVVGRMLSGVHWFTDVVGSILIGVSYLIIYSNILERLSTILEKMSSNEN